MMPGSFRIARVAGIDVFVHVTFFLLLAYFGWMGWMHGGDRGMVFALLAVIFLFGCVLLHEFGHALAARRYGIATPDITLLPIGGVARIERMPDKPEQEIVIAIAGPLVNVGIALILGSALAITGTFDLSVLTAGFWRNIPDIPRALINLLLINNVMLVIFNMIPAFPMDGGRVLRAVLAINLPLVKATRIAASIGQTLAVCIGLLGLFQSPPNALLILLAIFVFMGANQEARSVEVRCITRGATIQDVLITNFTALPRTATLQDAVDALLSSYQHDYPVVDDDGMLLGILTRSQMIAALKQNDQSALVANVMRTGIEAVTLDTDLDRVLQKLDSAETPVIPVEDRFHKLIGLIVPENVSEMIVVREALRERENAVRANQKLPSNNV